MADRISHVGLDGHKDGIVVAIAEGGRRGEVREYGSDRLPGGGTGTPGT